jgi:phage terminase large subunit-like protein
MEFYGWTKANDDLVMILQNAQTLSNAMKLVEADLRHKLINYNDHDIDKWCLGNASIKVNDLGQCLCVKSETAKRIDGAVALIILYEMYRRYRTEYKQIIGGVN